MSHYADSNLIMEKAIILRKRLLPSDVRGEVLVQVGGQVTPDEVVAWGTRAFDYVIIDVAGALRLDPDRNADKLAPILANLQVGNHLKKGDTIGESPKRAILRRLPKAPANSIISLVEQGRVILQVNPETIEVKARLAGEVVEVHAGEGVTIRAYGSVLQGAWGNGRFGSGRFEFEPQAKTELNGMQEILKLDLSLSPYTGKTIILSRPMTAEDLAVVAAHELTGLVAPCAPYELGELAMGLNVPVILTEGFGNLAPTTRLYDLLLERRTAQAIFDATPYNYQRGNRPEMILLGGVAPSEAILPMVDLPLAQGMLVRVRRAPYQGRIGQITDLPESPIRLDNGLRVRVAQLALTMGETVIVPQVNVELLGLPAQKP